MPLQRATLLALLLIVCLASVAWWMAPRLVHAWMAQAAREAGFEVEQLDGVTVSGRGLRIVHARMTRDNVTLEARDVSLSPGGVVGPHFTIGQVRVLAGEQETDPVRVRDLAQAVREMQIFPRHSGAITDLELCMAGCLSAAVVWQAGAATHLAATGAPGTLAIDFDDDSLHVEAVVKATQMHSMVTAHLQRQDGGYAVGAKGSFVAGAPGWALPLPDAVEGELRVVRASTDMTLSLPDSLELTLPGLVAGVEGAGTLTAQLDGRVGSPAAYLDHWSTLRVQFARVDDRIEIKTLDDVTAEGRGEGIESVTGRIAAGSRCGFAVEIACELLSVTVSLAVNAGQHVHVRDALVTVAASRDATVVTGQATGTVMEDGQVILVTPFGFRFEGETITADTRRATLLGVTPAILGLKHNFASDEGRFEARYEGGPAGLLPAIPDARTVAARGGEVRLQAAFRWPAGAAPLGFAGSVDAKAVELTVGGVRISGMNVSSRFSGWPAWRSVGASVFAASVDAGVLAEGVAADVELSGDAAETWRLDGRSFRAGVLGGEVTSHQFAWDGGAATGEAVFDLHSLSLHQVLALERDDFVAEGRLSGSVPVQFRQGKLIVTGGVVKADRPGGLIRFLPDADMTAFLAGNQQLDTVAAVLSDFRFHTLDALVGYSSDAGQLIAETALRGSNPAYQKGREIHFNVKLEEDLDGLLQSLRLGDEIVDGIEKRLRPNDRVR